MQFSSDEAIHYIGAEKGRAGDRDFYRVTVGTEGGDVIRFYCDAEVYGSATTHKFGDVVVPVIRAYQSSKGIGANLISL
jgi:hypothetical protein